MSFMIFFLLGVWRLSSNLTVCSFFIFRRFSPFVKVVKLTSIYFLRRLASMLLLLPVSFRFSISVSGHVCRGLSFILSDAWWKYSFAMAINSICFCLSYSYLLLFSLYLFMSLVNIFFLLLLNSPTHIFSDALQSNPGWVIIVILVMVPCTSHSVSKIISVMNCTQYGFMFPLSQEYSKLIWSIEWRIQILVSLL